MAAALFNTIVDHSKARAISAGTEPAMEVHPVVVAALREVGIDLSSQTPRKLTPELAGQADVLVTMGCGEDCPVVPGVQREDWILADPSHLALDGVRRIREEIRDRVESLIARHDWRAGPSRVLNPEPL
jgi:arsenate reductase